MHTDTIGQENWQSHRHEAIQIHLRSKLKAIYTQQDKADLAFDLLMEVAKKRLAERSDELKKLDAYRLANPDWFCGNRFMAYSTYVDRFAGDLKGVQAKIGWLKDMGVNYLHLLPFLKMRPGQNDGGFAVENFLEIEPSLGDLDQLNDLVKELRANQISLCSDLVLNHVADTHQWAIRAKAGDRSAQDCFHWKTEEQASKLEPLLPQIFPQTAPGNFVDVPEVGLKVWSTFYSYQWDLNYSNPVVLASMADNMLALANLGVEIFRLDSAAFLWKRDGTNSMNQPECHWLLQCFRAMVDLVAPGVLLKAEAIVPTAELPPYFGLGQDSGKECQIAYQSSLMAGAWFCLANQKANLLKKQIKDMPQMAPATNWICYVRCHDDIGWNVLKPELTPEEFEQLRYASRFFSGLEDQSYAHGETFQASSPNAVHGTNGMLSELVGWKEANDSEGYARYRLMLSLAFSLGGIPMLYMGDELAQGNASDSAADRSSWVDSRDLHRPAFDTDRQGLALSLPQSTAAMAFNLVKKLRHLQCSALGKGNTSSLGLIDTQHESVLAFQNGDITCVYNFSGQIQNLPTRLINTQGQTLTELLDGRTFTPGQIQLNPYDSLWLTTHAE